MPVTAVTLDTDGLSGTLTGLTDDQLAGELEATWIVDVDSPLDESAIVLDYFRLHPDLPYNGRGYNVGNKQSQSTKCDRLHAVAKPNTQKVWIVTAHFSNSAADENGSNNKRQHHRNSPAAAPEQTDDPIFWETDFNVYWRTLQDYDEPLFYISGISTEGGPRSGDKTGCLNSALVPMLDRPPWEVGQQVIEMSRYVEQFPQWIEDEAGGVNQTDVNFDYSRRGFSNTYKAGQLKFAGFSCPLEPVNKSRFWHAKAAFVWDRRGWYARVLDRSLQGRALTSLRNFNKSGFPNFVSGDKALESKLYHILSQPTADGRASAETAYISTPRLLNGKGEPDPAAGQKPNYIEYRNFFWSEKLAEIMAWFVET